MAVKKVKMDIEKYKIGNKFINNQGCEFEIVDIINNIYRKIRFNDEFKFEKSVQIMHIKRGSVYNPFIKSFYNIGYLGDYDSCDSTKNSSKLMWARMLQRCYSPNYLKKQPTYENVLVCDEWLCYANFQKWYNINYVVGFHLDKDLLQQNIVNKIYSPETCIFIPRNINNLLASHSSKNTSGYTGVSKGNGLKWKAECCNFETNKKEYLGEYCDIQEANNVYVIYKKQQINKAKEYMINLGFWDAPTVNKLDEII